MAQGNIGLSKWVFMRGLLSGPDELQGQPEYEAWKQKTGLTDHEAFFSEMIADHAAMKYQQGISYSVYKTGDDPETPLIHVGDFADEQGAIKALITEKGEAFAWNQEGKTLATRYESAYEAESAAGSGSGTIRVLERGIAPMRSPFIDQSRLEAMLAEAEQQVTKAGSIISARRFLRETYSGGAQLYQPNIQQGSSTGVFVWSDANVAVQNVGDHKFIVHAFKDIEAAMIEPSMVTKGIPAKAVLESRPFKISYDNGKVTIQEVDKNKESLENDGNDLDADVER